MTMATSTRMAKNKGLDWQNNSSAHATPLLIAHFFAVTARLRCENA